MPSAMPHETVAEMLSQHHTSVPGLGNVATSSTRVTPIKILFLIDQLCIPGGAERMLLKIIEALSGTRFRPYLATFKRNASIPLFNAFPCPFQELPLRRTYDLNALRMAATLRSLIRDNQIDIVHTFHETSDLWGGLITKLCGDAVLISSRRDMGYLRGKKHNLAYRFLSPHVNMVLAVSEEVRQHSILHDGVAPGRAITLHNGIDTSLIDNTPGDHAHRSQLGIPDESIVITTVGNIRPIKGIDILIRAAKLLCEQFRNLIFLVIGATGNGSYFNTLETLIDTLSLENNFFFLGPREDIVRMLKASDIFCLPSRTEGFSNALIEAMACRLPTVATTVGGNGEAITDGYNGYLVHPDDPEALASQLARLIECSDRRANFGTEGRATVERLFSFDGMMKRLTFIYENLVAQHA